MARFNGDPYWMTTRYPGECKGCKKAIRKGERAFYFPKGRRLLCGTCGDEADAKFRAEAWDEENTLCM